MVVTDGKLILTGRLAIKPDELLGRMKRNVYDFHEDVLDVVQMLIGAKKPIVPTLAPLVVWKKFHLGNEDVDIFALSATDFGYRDMPTIEEMFDTKRLKAWSKLNANRLGGYELEVFIRQQCASIRRMDDMRVKDDVVFAASGCKSFDTDPWRVVFDIHCRLGGQWHDKGFVEPRHRIKLTDRFLFRRRRMGT